MEETKKPENRHVTKVLIACAIFLLLGLGWFVYYWEWGRFFENTTDAYVNGNKISLNAQTTGNITGIYTDEADFVTQGQLLITLDETDARLKVELKKDHLANALRDVVSLFANAKETKSQITGKEADLVVAKREYERRTTLVSDGGVSLEDLQTAEAKFTSIFEEHQALQYKYAGLLAEIKQTTIEDHPRVRQAKDELREAWVALKRCQIKSPASGLIAQRKAQVGMRVKPETPLLSVIPINEMWVDANFKEVQLKKMRIGQKVRMKSDMYGSDLIFEGTLIGINGGTGSVFSVLPPQNATGNWIKIVQRLPVRISFEPKQLKDFPLMLGLSMDVRVDLRDERGAQIPAPTKEGILYRTIAFENQEEGVEEVIEKIVKENVFPSDVSLESQNE